MRGVIIEKDVARAVDKAFGILDPKRITTFEDPWEERDTAKPLLKICLELAPRDPNQAFKKIQERYHQLARELHPDKHPDNPSTTQKFQDLKNGYEILKILHDIRELVAYISYLGDPKVQEDLYYSQISMRQEGLLKFTLEKLKGSRNPQDWEQLSSSELMIALRIFQKSTRLSVTQLLNSSETTQLLLQDKVPGSFPAAVKALIPTPRNALGQLLHYFKEEWDGAAVERDLSVLYKAAYRLYQQKIVLVIAKLMSESVELLEKTLTALSDDFYSSHYEAKEDKREQLRSLLDKLKRVIPASKIFLSQDETRLLYEWIESITLRIEAGAMSYQALAANQECRKQLRESAKKMLVNLEMIPPDMPADTESMFNRVLLIEKQEAVQSLIVRGIYPRSEPAYQPPPEPTIQWIPYEFEPPAAPTAGETVPEVFQIHGMPRIMKVGRVWIFDFDQTITLWHTGQWGEDIPEDGRKLTDDQRKANIRIFDFLRNLINKASAEGDVFVVYTRNPNIPHVASHVGTLLDDPELKNLPGSAMQKPFNSRDTYYYNPTKKVPLIYSLQDHDRKSEKIPDLLALLGIDPNFPSHKITVVEDDDFEVKTNQAEGRSTVWAEPGNDQAYIAAIEAIRLADQQERALATANQAEPQEATVFREQWNSLASHGVYNIDD